MQEFVKSQIERSIAVKQELATGSLEPVILCGLALSNCLQTGGKILLAGNGGSAGDAQHIAAELVVRYKGGNERRALAALALTTDASVVTACGNDYGYDQVFARQVEALGNNGDCFIGITTSGNSKNIIHALETAKQRGLITILLTGKSGGEITAKYSNLTDHMIHVPTEETARVQESHIMIGQILCSIIEKQLFGME